MHLDHNADAARNYPPALLIPDRSGNPAASCIADDQRGGEGSKAERKEEGILGV